jgi:basic membrane lipoprotein Med (substrate-binding protein (PBP1-ABC) superfamily)
MLNTSSKRPSTVTRAVGALAALTLIASACGSDDEPEAEPATTEAEAPAEEETEAPAEEETEAPAEEETEAPAEEETEEPAESGDFDANGDGEVRIGIAAAGPRDDGAYYQAVVDAAESFSAENGFGEVIVVDNIQSADAATELDNLAQQPVDILIVGASEIAEPMADLAEQYSDIFWYCNCGAGFPESEFYLQSQDNGAAIAYTAGAATGIALRDSGGTAVTMIGCCDLGFEIQHYLSFELGLHSIDENLQFTYIQSGDFPFDFDNVQNATAAYENAVAEGSTAIYPYLGGAHEPLVQLANEGGQIVLSAGASDVCTREGDLSWDIAVRFDGGDYVREIFPQIIDGSASEGDIIVYSPGGDPSINGAVICDATAEQQAEMDAIYETIASGELDGEFGRIAGEAFGGS